MIHALVRVALATSLIFVLGCETNPAVGGDSDGGLSGLDGGNNGMGGRG